MEIKIEILKDLKEIFLKFYSQIKKEKEDMIEMIILNKNKVKINHKITYRNTKIKEKTKTKEQKEEEEKKLKKMNILQKSEELCPLFKNMKQDFEKILTHKERQKNLEYVIIKIK